MRFQRLLKTPPKIEITPRRVAAARRSVEKQKAKLGMFAGQFPVETVEERLDRIDRAHIDIQKWFRSSRAADWFKARRLLLSQPDEVRQSLIAEWNAAPYPGTPEYLLDFLHRKGIREGREGK